MFAASERGLESLLSEASRDMERVILNVGSVIEKRFKIKISNKLYSLLKALPYAMHGLRENITDKEGNGCCADKTRLIYYEEVLAEIKKLQKP